MNAGQRQSAREGRGMKVGRDRERECGGGARARYTRERERV